MSRIIRPEWDRGIDALISVSGHHLAVASNQEQRRRFYQEVHPLSRLIEFETGVAVRAMVTDKLADVSKLLYRVFENKMEYDLQQSKPGYLRLTERLTGSVVRLQTNDRMLTETFWNHYHNRDVSAGASG